jgi:predicted nucleic acid-binding protein
VIAYLDSSVILRTILGQPDQLKEWSSITAAVTSELAEVECLRTMDRLRAASHISDEQLAPRREAVYRILEAVELVEISRAVLRRASQPMPTPLGTLDAIHMATIELLRESGPHREFVVATHDAALALAARASGFHTIGSGQ